MFAIVKDTARRFTENETVVVTANDFDRDLAARFDFVEIEGDKGVRCFSLLFWAVLTAVLITLPFVHINPSKKILLALMKYAPYVKDYDGYDGSREAFRYKINDLQVDIDVWPDRIDFDEIYYKDELVSRGVRLYADGHLENYETYEFYWIEKAVKAILPLFRNEMINLRIKKIL